MSAEDYEIKRLVQPGLDRSKILVARADCVSAGRPTLYVITSGRVLTKQEETAAVMAHRDQERRRRAGGEPLRLREIPSYLKARFLRWWWA